MPSRSRRRFLKQTAAGTAGMLLVPGAAFPASPPAHAGRQDPGPPHYPASRAPLVPTPYIPLPTGAVRPAGWLRDQLEGWAEGMTGQLDEVWPDVGPENGWLGGEGDVWERGPYWLDGLVPLAYILRDEALIRKAGRWIEWSLASQQEDGFFGAAQVSRKQRGGSVQSGADWWPRMIMLKVLQQYHEATGDERVIELMRRYFRYQLRELPQKPLGHWSFWGQRRGGENLASVHWLYDRTGEAWLLDLGELIFRQTEDWTARFTTDHGIWHVVNTAMGIKQPGIWYRQSGDRRYLEAVESGIRYLMSEHGQPQGIWSGDELLHGTDPVQGVETCAVVEYMFSLESLLGITGSVAHADRLEKVAYNALPAALAYDFHGRHYYQTPNQVACTTEYHDFSTQHGDDNLVGLETGYGCCTANLHQGWPKLVAHLWMATPDGGLARLVYGPSVVTARVGPGRGTEVRFEELSDYPFSEEVRLVYRGPDGIVFPLHLRIPGWAEGATVRLPEGSAREVPAGTIQRAGRTWYDGDEIVLHLPMRVRLSRGHERSVAVEHGPLVYALKREERWEVVGGEEPYTDRQITTPQPWNYGLTQEAVEAPERAFQVSRGPVGPQPWTPDSAPVRITTPLKRIGVWQRYLGMTGPIPFSPVRSPEPEERLELVPYGGTTIRISAFPVVRT